MVTRNILIFSEPSIDRCFVLDKLLARSSEPKSSNPPPIKMFQTQVHSVLSSSKNHYEFYDVAGLDSKTSNLDPREALSNLYRFTLAFDGGINLLIYVVGDSHSINNIKLFYDYLCARDVPIILVTSNPHPPPTFRFESENLPHFNVVLTLNGANPENDRTSIREAISVHIKRDPRNIHPIERFEATAKGFWKMSERAAGWSISDCRDALKATLMQEAYFSEKDADARSESIVESIKQRYFCNVIVFGDTGAGKTSVVKMLSDKVELDTTKAASAGGSTFESRAYEVDINEGHYVFHDTVGLDDGTSISLSPQEALKCLYQLMLKVEGGVSLLVYVHRGKIKPSQVENYKLFTQVICKSKVPTALVVTGLEEEDSRDEWWKANKHLFDELGIATEYYACITSTKGLFNQKYKEFVYQDQYDESKSILKALFVKASLSDPWKIPTTPNWWKSLVVEVYNTIALKLKWPRLVANESLYNDLVKIGGMAEEQAKNWANNMDRVFQPARKPRYSVPP